MPNQYNSAPNQASNVPFRTPTTREEAADARGTAGFVDQFPYDAPATPFTTDRNPNPSASGITGHKSVMVSNESINGGSTVANKVIDASGAASSEAVFKLSTDPFLDSGV